MPLGHTSGAKIDNTPGSTLSVDSRVSIVITPSQSPLADEAPPEGQAFEWPSECQHMLLDPGIVNDNHTQALLLTTLVSTKTKIVIFVLNEKNQNTHHC